MLTNKEIFRQMTQGNIQIDNLRENALEKPNSCIVGIGDELYVFDYQIFDTRVQNNFIGEVTTGITNKLRKVHMSKEGFLLEPGKVYLAKTTERIKTNGYVPVLNGRTSLSLLGVSIELNSGYKSDHFNDYCYLSIVCTKPTYIYPNIEIGNLTFFRSIDHKSEEEGMLSGEEIKRQMPLGNILISPQDQIVINPNSVNLTLNERIGIYTDPILDIKKNNNIEFSTIGDAGIKLFPNEIYVARTNEWTETYNLVPMMSGRSSLGRVGEHVHCSAGMGSIGFKGYWHMGIRVTAPLRVYKNNKCCQIYYYTVEGDIANTYSGSMQNLSGEELGSQFYKKLSR